MKDNVIPFLWGVQYYRAPTPHRKYWEQDLTRIAASGFDTVKFWVQWRWSERVEGEYFWEDLDELMILAGKCGLHVVLNLILDVMPVWVARDYPETLMEDIHGERLESETFLARQLGGYPGPCHANELMREKRARFTRKAVRHFKKYPALLMWDVWNEPESHSKYRKTDVFPELCYCPACRRGFLNWIRKKYRTIGSLNEVWGRCYRSFDEVEIPRDTGTVNDFIDWREYHADTLLEDAKWRLDIVREEDPDRHPHLHVVPSTIECFSPMTCIDDHAIARYCEIFGSSMVNDPFTCAQAISAAQGRWFYNAEWHVNFGGNAFYQRVINRKKFLNELLPQIGWGVKGFLFWQYRAERLGTEAPAWGVVRPDGSSRPITEHAIEFSRSIQSLKDQLLKTHTVRPKVLIWRGIRNELFQFCRHKKLQIYANTMKAYCDILYTLDVPFQIVDTQMLENICFDEPKMLILPQAYYLEKRDVDAFEAFLEKGGTIFSENNLGAYSSDDGLFSERVPGFGLDERWGIRETESTWARHLPSELPSEKDVKTQGDVKKALEASGIQGSEYFILSSADKKVQGYGAIDFCSVSGGETLADFMGNPCSVSKKVGKGTVFYTGTMLGYASVQKKDDAILRHLLILALKNAGIHFRTDDLHIDILYDPQENPAFQIISNKSGKDRMFDPGPEWMEFMAQPASMEPDECRFYYRKTLLQE